MKYFFILLFCSSSLVLSQETADSDLYFKIWGNPLPNESLGKYGLDTTKCEENLSIYTEFYKQKSYNDALLAWQYLFFNSPSRTKNIYIHGANMFKSFIKTIDDSLQRDILIDKLLSIYDQRNIFYPGQEGLILGYKGSDLYKYKKTDLPSVKEAYSILQTAFSMDKEKTSARTLSYYFQAAQKLTVNNILPNEKLIELFTDLSSTVDYKEADINKSIFNFSQKTQLTAKESKKKKKLNDELVKLNDLRAIMERVLAPIVTCDKLVSLYENSFESNNQDSSWLDRAAQLLRKKDCVDTDIYFRIAEQQYESNPTPKSAFNMGIRSLKKEDFTKAINYFNQAVEGESDHIKKSDYLFYLSKSYAGTNQNKTAKQKILQAIKLRPGWGKPYILLGDLYAQSSRSCGENTGNLSNDEFTKRVGYWAALEKYRYAKKIDNAIQEEANKKIKLYSSQAPDKTSTFQIIGLTEEFYTINCWYIEKVRNPYFTK